MVRNCAALTRLCSLLLQQQTTECRRISRHIPICVFVLCFRVCGAMTYLRIMPMFNLPIFACVFIRFSIFTIRVYLGACRFALIFLRACFVCRFALNSARFSFLPKFIISYVWRLVILLRF